MSSSVAFLFHTTFILWWTLLFSTETKCSNHGLRFVIFRTLSGPNYRFSHSSCLHNAFAHLQFAIEYGSLDR